MLYKLFKSLVALIAKQFFTSIKIIGSPKIESGPLLIVSNHPNSALDPFLIGLSYNRQLWFVAKSTLFRRSLISWILDKLHMIPIYRKQDNDNRGSNQDSFRAIVGKLAAGQAVVIFPEGTSMGERRLLPLKSGAARLAFQAEEESDFRLGLRIQPVGITYTDLSRFRSSVTLAFDDPIAVSSLRNAFESSADDAVTELTSEIESKLRAVTVDIQDLNHQALVEKIGKVYQSRGLGNDDFERLKLVAKNVEELSPRLQHVRLVIEKRIDSYLSLLAVFNLNEDWDMNSKSSLSFMLGLTPFVLLGILAHYLPYRLTGYLVRKFTDHPAVKASLKVAIGVSLFSVWYVLFLTVAFLLSGSYFISLALFVIILTCGHFANQYLQHMHLFVLSCLWPGNSNPVDVLSAIGDGLIKEMNDLRVD